MCHCVKTFLEEQKSDLSISQTIPMQQVLLDSLTEYFSKDVRIYVDLSDRILDPTVGAIIESGFVLMTFSLFFHFQICFGCL